MLSVGRYLNRAKNLIDNFTVLLPVLSIPVRNNWNQSIHNNSLRRSKDLHVSVV